MTNILNRSEGAIRLLVLATDLTPLDATFVEICGSRWVLIEFARISDAPPYTCISYSWGSGRVDNMFENGQLMSYRTIPAIEATIKASQSPEHWGNAVMCSPRNALKESAALTAALTASQAIWIDALCVPSRDPARAACLQSMGAIYSSAAQVFVVLSEPCSKLLQQINNTGLMSPEQLFVLENDNWITRAWTYQEMANSKSTLFIAQGDGSVLFLVQDFLNAILTNTTGYADAQGFDRAELAIRFPRLEGLQVMMAEHRLVEFTGRSAYQVMSAMKQRFAEREEDRIYASIGVITTLSSDSVNNGSLHPAEYFMRDCEAKEDFSFIYCTAPRSEHSGKCWRPVADQLHPILPGFLTSGQGQSGSLSATHLTLKNMARLNFGSVNTEAAKSIANFLQSGNANFSPSDLGELIFERLRQLGFSGCGDYLELENGYFYPQSPISNSQQVLTFASGDLIWQFGAPGLLVSANGTDIHRFLDVGVFVGRIPKISESINIE